jgi:NitT/TauT family transport system substrate-binding protein
MIRREFISLAAAFPLAGGTALAQTPGPLVPLRVASAPDEDVLGALWGQSSGIFRRYGLDVRLQAMNSGAAVGAAVVGGAIDIGKSSLVSLISAHTKGIPFELIAPAGVYNSKAPIVGLLVKKGANIKSARDLNGKTFSVPSLNDQYSIAIKGWMDQRGGDWQSLKFLELPNSAVPQAIEDSRVDAASIANPILSEAIASGKVDMIGRTFDAIGPHFIQACYFVTADFATKNRDVVERFSKAIAESGAYCNAHHAATVQLLSDFTKVSPETISHMTRTEIGTTLDPRELQPVIDAAAKYKLIASAFPAREMIAPFLRKE